MGDLKEISGRLLEYPALASPFIGIAKVPLCLLIGCSTLFGYVLASPRIRTESLFVSLAIFILATGCASLNSLQEHKLDALQARTNKRPLVLGYVLPRQALFQATVLISIGLLLLYLTTSDKVALFFAIVSLGLYNGIYTPLKKKSAWAIVPGTICGALPPYIGWLCGGGDTFSYFAWLLLTLLVLWQVPHFWLVVLHHQDDYRESSFPTLLQQLSEKRLKKLFVTWIGGLSAVMAMYTVLPTPPAFPFRVAILVNAILLLFFFLKGLMGRSHSNYNLLFIVLNCSFFLHMLFVAVGRVVGNT